jgi:Leucine-rich repeat (LRR) protein
MIIHFGRKKRSILDHLLFPLIPIFYGNLFWLPSIWAATDCSNVAVTTIPKEECDTLVALYNSTGGPNWSDSLNNKWNATNTPCSWTGIECEDGHVVKIDRLEKNLTGSIPNWSALTSLQYLSLGGNRLTGSIPDWSTLTSLQYLSLGNNRLTGSIPDWSALTSLQTLSLVKNQLSGSIPDWSTLTSLQYLYLSYNQLTGSIPDWSALTNLQRLFLNSNQLCGKISNSLVNLPIELLSLGNNHLTASMPLS